MHEASSSVDFSRMTISLFARLLLNMTMAVARSTLAAPIPVPHWARRVSARELHESKLQAARSGIWFGGYHGVFAVHDTVISSRRRGI